MCSRPSARPRRGSAGNSPPADRCGQRRIREEFRGFDTKAAGQRHDALAHIPEVHAGLSNKVFYANPNAASKKFVKKEVADNKSIFLEPAAMKTMVAPDSLPQAIRKVQTRTFTYFKAGR